MPANFYPPNASPLVVAYGMGVDSTAVLIGLRNRGIRPDLIMFADVGAEREATYGYLPVITAWLREVGFPDVTVVRYVPTNFKHWPEYHSLEENILTNATLPSIAYGKHSCSSKWKIGAEMEFVESWEPAKAAWRAGEKVRMAVGFEDSPHERNRMKKCATFPVADIDAARYETIFPLVEWGWDRARCVREIEAAGLAAPMKSSCYFCTAMKPGEVETLSESHLMKLVIIEARAAGRNLKYTEDRRENLTSILSGGKEATEAERAAAVKAMKRMPPEGVAMCGGLWRTAVKGVDRYGRPNGAVAKPAAMTDFIREKGLLPSELIDALIAITPTETFTKADFVESGISDWSEWLRRTIAAARAMAGLEEVEAGNNELAMAA